MQPLHNMCISYYSLLKMQYLIYIKSILLHIFGCDLWIRTKHVKKHKIFIRCDRNLKRFNQSIGGMGGCFSLLKNQAWQEHSLSLMIILNLESKEQTLAYTNYKYSLVIDPWWCYGMRCCWYLCNVDEYDEIFSFITDQINIVVLGCTYFVLHTHLKRLNFWT